MMVHPWLVLGGLMLGAAAMVYSLFALVAVYTRIRPVAADAGPAPAVTLLKPLCGVEPETYECLRSFCAQSYREFQVVFGVSDASDPVIAIVRRLQEEFPHRDLQLVVDRRLHGSSRKVSNLINMMPAVRHEYLVLSDSDVRVAEGYLAKVVAPLAKPDVGIVTCAYRGVPRRGMWSRLGAMYINDWFMPSVRVAAMTGSRAFAFGATIALRRSSLAGIGGFAAIADQIADDYRLGELTRRIGLKTVLSEVTVDTYITERSFADLVRHELRWLRTIRAVRPVGYGFSFVTCSVPVALIGSLLSGEAAAGWSALAITAVARVMLHLKTRQKDAGAAQLLMLPGRDLMTLILWTWSFATRRVHWREDRFLVARDGTAQPILRT